VVFRTAVGGFVPPTLTVEEGRESPAFTFFVGVIPGVVRHRRLDFTRVSFDDVCSSLLGGLSSSFEACGLGCQCGRGRISADEQKNDGDNRKGDHGERWESENVSVIRIEPAVKAAKTVGWYGEIK
jgi:hypothetical protein